VILGLSLDRAAGFGFAGGLLLVAGAIGLILWGGPRPAPDAGAPVAGTAADAAPAAPEVVPSESPVENYRRGRDLLAHGYRRHAPEQAVALFRAVLAADEGYAPAHAGLAEAYLWRYGRERDPLLLDRAREQADLAVEKEPQLAAAYVARGTVRLVQGEVPEATADLEEATRLDPRSTDAHRELANAHQKAGRVDESVLSLDRAASLAPEDWRVWERQGLFALRSRAPDLAERPLRRAIELAPDNPGPYKNLAAALIRDSRLEEAASALQGALEIEPWESTYTNLGTLQFLLGRYEASRASFERAIELGAQDDLNWANVADAYRWTDRSEQAADAYRRAVQLLRRDLESSPDDPRMRSRLALYLAKQGDGDEALAELAKLPEEAAGAPDVLLRRLVVEELTGRRDAALETLAAALEAGVSLDDVERDPELSELRGDPRYQLLVTPYVETGSLS
jgi:serine/threonine-protein kinase